MKRCPFRVGAIVIYKPSSRGHGQDDDHLFEIGKKYRIERIDNDSYVVVEGYQHPGGGIFWTEFEKPGPK